MKSLIIDSKAYIVDIEKSEWRELMNIAQAKIIEIKGRKMAQVIVALTARENIYLCFLDYKNSLVLNEEEHFLKGLKTNTDTVVKKMVCMWSDGSVDFPAYSLREKMIQLNLQNEFTEMLLNGYGGFIVKKMGKTMK